jgi:hypothetical protein
VWPRDWTDRAQIAERLFHLPPGSTIVHGAAKGADRIAAQEGQKLGHIIEAHPYAEFISIGISPKRAPLLRNFYMANLGADLCIAFWDGRSSGTAHMVDCAEAAGIEVELFCEGRPVKAAMGSDHREDSTATEGTVI